jgi:hypothetical protein
MHGLCSVLIAVLTKEHPAAATEGSSRALHVTFYLRTHMELQELDSKMLLGEDYECMRHGLPDVHLCARMRLHARLSLSCLLGCRELSAQYQALVLEQKALTDEEFWSSAAMLKVAGVAGT